MMSKWESEGKLFRYSNLFYWLKTMGIWTILCITICFDACRAVVLWYICIMWRHISQVLGIYNFAFVSHFIVFKRDNYLVIIICVLLHHHDFWHKCVNCYFHSFVVKCLLQSLEVWRLAKIFETNKIYQRKPYHLKCAP